MADSRLNSTTTSLIVNLIKEIVIEFKEDPNVTALILTGSYANKSHLPYSDVDIVVFYKDISRSGIDYDLRYHNDTLISITGTDIATWETDLKNSKKLIFIYRAIQNSIILFDKEKEFEIFKSNISPTPWVFAEPDRRARIDSLAVGYIEEVHKLLNMLIEFDESTAVNALNSICLGMAELMALQQKILVQTENEYYDKIQSSVGWETKWTALFREAFNLQLTGDFKTIDLKIVTGLMLYSETMNLINLSKSAEKKVNKALRLINLRLLRPS